MHDYDSLIHGQ